MFDQYFKRFDSILAEATVSDEPTGDVSIEGCKNSVRELMAAAMKSSNTLLSYTLKHTDGTPEAAMTGDLASKIQKLLNKLERYTRDIENPEKLAAVSAKSAGDSVAPGADEEDEMDDADDESDVLDQEAEDVTDKEKEDDTLEESIEDDIQNIKVGDYARTYRLVGGRTIEGKVAKVDGDILSIMVEKPKIVKVSKDQLEYVSQGNGKLDEAKKPSKKKIVKAKAKKVIKTKKGKKVLKESEEAMYSMAEPIISKIITKKVDEEGIEWERINDDDMVVEIATEAMEELHLPPNNNDLAMYMEFTHEVIHELQNLFQRETPESPGMYSPSEPDPRNSVVYEAKTLEEAKTSMFKDLDALLG